MILLMQSSHGGFSSFPRKSNCMCVTSARYDSLIQNPSLLCLDLVSKEMSSPNSMMSWPNLTLYAVNNSFLTITWKELRKNKNFFWQINYLPYVNLYWHGKGNGSKFSTTINKQTNKINILWQFRVSASQVESFLMNYFQCWPTHQSEKSLEGAV